MILSLELTRAAAAVILADSTGKPLQAARHSFGNGFTSPAAQWLELVKLARDLCFREVVDPQRLSVIGVAFEGTVSAQGRVQKSPLVAGWDGYDLPRAVREHLNAPHAQVVTAPRVLAEAWGEAHLGAFQGVRDWLFVHLGRHLESVACVKGQVLESDLSDLVIERDGVLDDFGRRGTLGAYCGGLAFESRARTYAIPFVQAHEVWPLAPSNFTAHALVEDFVSRLAQGLCGGIALLKPQKICISGGFGRAIWPLIREPLALKLREVVSAQNFQHLEFCVSSLGEDGASLGMLALATETEPQGASA